MGDSPIIAKVGQAENHVSGVDGESGSRAHVGCQNLRFVRAEGGTFLAVCFPGNRTPGTHDYRTAHASLANRVAKLGTPAGVAICG